MRERILSTVILLLISLQSFAQNSFVINKNNTDSIQLDKYKIFAVASAEQINFIGRTVPTDDRFTLTTDQARQVDNAINTQYADACINQYFVQQNSMRLFSDSTDLIEAKEQYKRTHKKVNRSFRDDQKSKIRKFDRYLYGFTNSDGEHLVLVRFDPHKIEWYSIPGTGESHMDVLSIMVYNIEQNKLRLSGWAEFEEE